MKAPTYADSFEVLCLQAADEGRGEVLFGDSVKRARAAIRPFMVGREFPGSYLEFPLVGDPFLDVTVLYGDVGPDCHVDSPAAPDADELLEWFASARERFENVSFGFELDTKDPGTPTAAVHFQPRKHTELVRTFCEVVGEPQRAELYLDLAARMPDGWPLSFFGMFKGRSGSPLRVCGYMNDDERKACAADSAHLRSSLERVGFSAYDDTMLEQASTLMGTAPGSIDFQFDVYPDGTIGDVFAIDAQFAIENPEAVRASFEGGPGAHVMNLLENWGIADNRWHLVAEAAFARALPATQPDGTLVRYGFTLMPQWVKVRWANKVLQPSKLYHLAKAGPLKAT